MKTVKTFIGDCGQWVSGVICGSGILIEVLLKSDIGFVIITLGAVLFAVSTWFKYQRKRAWQEWKIMQERYIVPNKTPGAPREKE